MVTWTMDTTASDPRESEGKSLREGNKAIRSSQAQVSWLLREGRGICKERLAIKSQLSTRPYIPDTLLGAPNPVRPKTLMIHNPTSRQFPLLYIIDPCIMIDVRNVHGHHITSHHINATIDTCRLLQACYTYSRLVKHRKRHARIPRAAQGENTT